MARHKSVPFAFNRSTNYLGNRAVADVSFRRTTVERRTGAAPAYPAPMIGLLWEKHHWSHLPTPQNCQVSRRGRTIRPARVQL